MQRVFFFATRFISTHVAKIIGIEVSLDYLYWLSLQPAPFCNSLNRPITIQLQNFLYITFRFDFVHIRMNHVDLFVTLKIVLSKVKSITHKKTNNNIIYPRFWSFQFSQEIDINQFFIVLIKRCIKKTNMQDKP